MTVSNDTTAGFDAERAHFVAGRSLVGENISAREYECGDTLLAALAEIKRLTAALEIVVGMGDYVYKPHEFAEIARQALRSPADAKEPRT